MFSSGMAAIATLLLAYCSPGDVIVHSGPLYAATEGLIARILSRFGVGYVDFPAGATRAEIEDALERGSALATRQGGKLAMIYLESPANPTNALVDIEAVAAARDALAGRPAACRSPSTTLSSGPLWQRPLDHGADIVGLLADQICRRAFAISSPAACRAPGSAGPGPHDAQHDGHDLRSQHRLDAAAQPRDARTAHEPRRRECGESLRVPASDHPKVETVGYLGLSPSPAPAGHLTTATAAARASRSRSISRAASARLPLPRRAQDRQARGQPRRHRNAGEPPGGDDPLSVPEERKASARHHRQSGAHLDRHRGCRRPHRRLRTGAGGGLTPHDPRRKTFAAVSPFAFGC